MSRSRSNAVIVWLLVVFLATAGLYWRRRHERFSRWSYIPEQWATEPSSAQSVLRLFEASGLSGTPRSLALGKNDVSIQRSRALESKVKKKKKATNGDELEADRKKKARLIKRRHAPIRHHHSAEQPLGQLFSKQSRDRPSPSPITTLGGLIIGARHGNAKGSPKGHYADTYNFVGGSASAASGGSSKGGSKSERSSYTSSSSSISGKGKKMKTGKGKGKSHKMSGTPIIARDQVLTPAPLAFRLETQPTTSQNETSSPSPHPTVGPSPQPISNMPTLVPTPATQLIRPTMTPTMSPSVAETTNPTPGFSLQPDITQVPGLITLTFPPTESPSFESTQLNTTAPPTTAPPTVVPSDNTTDFPTTLPAFPSTAPSASPSMIIADETPAPTFALPTASPTIDTGVRRIRIEPFYIGFEIPAPERAPMQDEYDYVKQLTTLYFEEIFATLYQDAEYSFEVIELTLLYTGFETAFPEERFTVYMEFGADMVISGVADNTGELPTSGEVLEVMVGAIDETYVVQYIWSSERESPFFRTQDVVAAVAPLKLPDSNGIAIDTRGPRDKSSDFVAVASRDTVPVPVENESTQPSPIRIEEGEIATSESFKELSSRFILPGTSIIEQLFQSDGE